MSNTTNLDDLPTSAENIQLNTTEQNMPTKQHTT